MISTRGNTMKSFRPWFYLLTTASSSILFADNGIEAYRQGDYVSAAQTLNALSTRDPMSNYYLGLMSLYGYGQLKNDELALRSFTQSAEKGYLPAQKMLANYYLNRAQDPEQALVWFKKAADQDDTSAHMYVAAAYLFGFGTKPNDDAARRYYIEAAKNGNAIAQYTLAEHFLDSRQIQNKKMGLIWLIKAADNGNPKAQNHLGKLYANGTLVPTDTIKAKQLLESAANAHFVPAYVSLGEMAVHDRDLNKARDWFTKAASEGDLEGQRNLALLLLDPSSSFHNTESAYLWMLKAAQNGSHEAQLGLAKMYKDGIGKPVDKDLAKEWEKTAEKNASNKSGASVKDEVALWLSNGKSKSLDQGAYQLGGIYTAWKNAQALKENRYNQAPQMKRITRDKLYRPQFVMTKPDQISISDYFDVLAPQLGNFSAKSWYFPRYDFDTQIDAVLHDGFHVMKQDANAFLVERGTPYQTTDDSMRPYNYFDEKTKGWEYKANLQTALNDLYGQAILGESTAQFELGQLYQYGVGVAKNIDQALSYFELAAAQQDIRAEYNLGLLYLTGETNPVNYKKGMEWMTDSAFKGNPYAQYVLANIYENGLKDPTGTEIVAPDHEQAMAMYYLAASNNFGSAQFRLADYLVKEKRSGLQGLAKQNREKLIKRLYQGAVDQGVADAILPLAFYNAMDKNPLKQREAFLVAKKQAEEGLTEAALLFGMMLERGIATAQNKEGAIYWYQQAGVDNPVSDFILGTYYSQGKGLTKDVEKGYQLLEKSAKDNFSYANLNLAILKHDKNQSYKEELNKARLSGNAKAGLLLADTYLLAANDASEIQAAADIYRFFAEKGDKDAQMKLGFYYDRALGGESNPEMAAHWYKLSAEQGQPIAQYLLGQMYQLGHLSTQPDYQMAKKCYGDASRTYPAASTALSFIYDTVDNDYDNSVKYALKAASDEDAIAKFNLGLVYEYGKGTAVDNTKAFSYYTQAANADYAKAMIQLAGLYYIGVEGNPNPEMAK